MPKQQKMLEHAILEVLWSRQDPVSHTELTVILQAPLTQELRSMEKRGLLVQCEPSTYKAQIDFQGYRIKMLEDLIAHHFDGDLIAVWKALINITQPEDRAVFHRILDDIPIVKDEKRLSRRLCKPSRWCRIEPTRRF